MIWNSVQKKKSIGKDLKKKKMSLLGWEFASKKMPRNGEYKI